MENTQGALIGIDEYTVYKKKKGDCYRLIAACFYPPKKNVFMQEGLFRTLAGLLNDVCPSASIHAAAMGNALGNSSDDELALEYARLFVGPFELKAPPYGSVYIDKERKVMGDSTVAVTKCYQNSGLAISDDFRELPDHIAVELEFMYYLIFKETEVLGKSETDNARYYLNIQDTFKHKFLGKWAAPFCDKIKEGTENTFYRELSDCLLAFVSMELEGEALPEGLRA